MNLQYCIIMYLCFSKSTIEWMNSIWHASSQFSIMLFFFSFFSNLEAVESRWTHVLSEVANVVASREVVGHCVPFAVFGARAAETDLTRFAPHDLGEMTFALLKIIAVVVVVRLLVPLVGHLFARQLVTLLIRIEYIQMRWLLETNKIFFLAWKK